MASPVIMTELAFSLSTSRHTVWGSNLGTRMVRLPTKLWPMIAPLGGTVHQRCDGQQGEWAVAPLLDHLLGALDPGVGGRVDASAQRVEDILVPPHHPLGHAGGPARVEDVVVVVRARGEIPLGTAGGHGLLVGHRPLRLGRIGPVLDGDQQPDPRELGEQLGDPGTEFGLVDQGHQVGVGEQVPELVLHVAVVDVDPHRPELEHGPGRLDPLHAVQRVDPDMVTGPDTLLGQIVGQPVGPLLHLRVGAALPGCHQVLPVAVGVNGGLEQISEVERRHRAVSRTRFHSGGNTSPRSRAVDVADQGFSRARRW